MLGRTDLALEEKEVHNESINGIEYKCDQFGEIKVSKIKITSNEASKKLSKAKGDYVTVELPALTDYFKNTDERINIISEEIKKFVPEKGSVLVIGIGNSEITPDALGPKTASMILATRHIPEEIKKSIGLENIRSVSVLAPGVLGQTGIEISEIIKSLLSNIKPGLVIAIDSLASRRLNRLGCTVQISNTGITPGSGIGNIRLSISKEELGIPVIGIGVPTVVEATTLACDLLNAKGQEELKKIKEKVSPREEAMIVTPREIDLLIKRASSLISMSINCALHPQLSTEDLLSLVS